MNICGNIDKDEPDSILGVAGADSGVKIEKNAKYETQKNRKKSMVGMVTM